MIREIAAAAIIAVCLAGSAQADEQHFTISCTGETNAIYTVDLQNDRYAEIDGSNQIVGEINSDIIKLDAWAETSDYTYHTTSGGSYIDLNSLIIYAWYHSDYSDRQWEAGSCQIVNYIPIAD